MDGYFFQIQLAELACFFLGGGSEFQLSEMENTVPCFMLEKRIDVGPDSLLQAAKFPLANLS